MNRTIIQPIHFYNTKKESYYHGDCEACEAIAFQNCEKTPAFILERPSNFALQFFRINIICNNNQLVHSIPYYPTIVTIDVDGVAVDQVFFPEIEIPEFNCQCGSYRLLVQDTNQNWWSDYFKMTDTSKHVEISWRHKCDMGNIHYSAHEDFRFVVYLDPITGICEPSYEFIIEGSDNNRKEESEVCKKLSKIYNLETSFITEMLYDAIAFGSIHSDVEIDGFECVQDIVISEPEWTTTGCSSPMSMTFRKDESKLSTDCCDSHKIECIEPTIEIINFNDQSTCWLEDPGKLAVGDCIYFASACTDPNIFSNLSCLSIADAAQYVGMLGCWDGDCFEFSTPPQYALATINGAQCVVSVVANTYQVMPDVSIVNIGDNLAEVTAQIPQNYSACIYRESSSISGFQLIGIFSQQEIASGVEIDSGLLQNPVPIRVEVKNYNCGVLASKDVIHTFTITVG